MEAKITLGMENYQQLIPTILSNIKKIQKPNKGYIPRESIYAELSAMPMPTKVEIDYLVSTSYAMICLDKFIRENLHEKGEHSYSTWINTPIINSVTCFYVLEREKIEAGFIESLYKNSNNEHMLHVLVNNSVYSSLKCLEFLADKRSYDLQKIAVTISSLEVVKKLTKSNYDKVRAEAYKRLGPAEYLDEMLVDKSRHVRAIAASWIPMGYTVPQKALLDRAYWSFTLIADKVSVDQIPMLLGNKNLAKNKALVQKLQARMESKV
jgi:hypothetical protein